MLRSHFAAWLSISSLGFAAGAASAQSYPMKPVRMVTSTAGGGADIIARLIAQGLSSIFGQQFIVENRSGIIAGEIVAKSPPDGYTLLVSGSVLWLAPFLQSHVSYQPIADFSPIALTHMAPNILVVHPSLPAKSVQALSALAKSRPGQINYAAGAVASPNHLAGELFKTMAGVNIVAVPYKGSGPMLNALLGGEVELGFVNPASAMPHVRSGRLRALGVTTPEASPLAPGLPTVAAAGLLGYESMTLYGVLAPAKTAVSLINRLNQEINRVVNQSDVKDKFQSSGMAVVGNSPEEFAAIMKSDMARNAKVIKDCGMRAG